MSLFTKAQSNADRLKMYVYGQTGTGKTITALHFPSPVVIDAEKGTAHYGGMFDFHKLESSNPKDLHAALDELLKNPGEFKTLVIDPFTVIYDNIIKEREDEMRARSGNTKYEIQPLDYKYIKSEVKLLMNKILSLDMNIVVTARSKALYAKGKFMEVLGQQPEGHKDMPYMFDVVLELNKTEDGKRIATVEKDRTNKLPHEFEFTYDSFVQYIGIKELERDASAGRQQDNLDERNSRTTSVTINGKNVKTAGVSGETLEKLMTLTADADPSKLSEMLKEDFGVGELLDLTEKAARTFLNAIDPTTEQ